MSEAPMDMPKPFYLSHFMAAPGQWVDAEGPQGKGAGFRILRDEVQWLDRVEARQEAFMSQPIRDYTYGKGGGERTYTSVPFHPQVLSILDRIRNVTALLVHHGASAFGVPVTSAAATGGCLTPATSPEIPASYECRALNACFLNRYNNERQALGWHADDSPGQDHSHPIAVFTCGQPREIWWRPKGFTGPIPKEWRQLLEPGSLFVMPGGFQQTHEHRIPKGDRAMGTRISLTFRSFL